MKLNVTGVMFHLGSNVKDPQQFKEGITMARSAFDTGKKLGFDFNILDIGGGYPGAIDFDDDNNIFFQEAKVINEALDNSFPKTEYPNIKIIAGN